MTKVRYLFSSESVSEGHPDKVCDRISDAVVDTYLGADRNARVAVETLCTTNHIVVAGEVRGPEDISHSRLEDVARECVRAGFEVIETEELVCFTATTNSRSRNVMEKVGFRYEKDFVYADIVHSLCRLDRDRWRSLA